MNGTHYRWEAEGKKHVFTGQPTRRAFDPFNGDQVLFLINFYASLIYNFSLQDGQELEQDILHHLPAQVKSEISVLSWIQMHRLNVR